eukprot:TRINITY_DN170_c0_g2_i7.p1 TRINITY_DN170_c0_g2~~TRINITY_DN170_c0_g2_i7.p1  ORF type:complete len:135 (-),score=9.68 TRINITY_DN170_c0_g2_i7:164-508(-)
MNDRRYAICNIAIKLDVRYSGVRHAMGVDDYFEVTSSVDSNSATKTVSSTYAALMLDTVFLRLFITKKTTTPMTTAPPAPPATATTGIPPEPADSSFVPFVTLLLSFVSTGSIG